MAAPGTNIISAPTIIGWYDAPTIEVEASIATREATAVLSSPWMK